MAWEPMSLSIGELWEELEVVTHKFAPINKELMTDFMIDDFQSAPDPVDEKARNYAPLPPSNTRRWPPNRRIATVIDRY